ncbi:hypothetical protein [Mammaliicoccus lentus]|uniref:hypothetical protein n=1 Tax=Mammaliicoccus lentus TaxID=42858 RepID=UPI001071C046|nr:hypothetical protein [Mammaliicoccus lentus]MBF0795215.1 hypothetical protein [Mammaliicoccus lentus]TFV14612.1 hypothetical protein E4T78_11145 [Mammaliicoccus lentus]
MKLTKMSNKARNNKTGKSSHVISDNGIKFTLEYKPIAEGYNGQYIGNTFYVHLKYGEDNDLIGDLYDNQDGTFSMWVDKHSKLVEGLTDVMHLERAYMDGNLTDNPIH